MKHLLMLFVFLLLHSSGASAQAYTDFAMEDINGNEITLSTLLEKGPVMLGFWRAGCSSCKDEQRNMQIIYEKYKSEGFSYIGFNIDNQKSVSKVKGFVSAMGFTFPVILDTDKKMFELFGGSEDAVPYSLLIGTNKTILHVHLGYLPGDDKNIEDEIKNELLPK